MIYFKLHNFKHSKIFHTVYINFIFYAVSFLVWIIQKFIMLSILKREIASYFNPLNITIDECSVHICKSWETQDIIILKISKVCWCISIIPALWKVEERESQVWSQPVSFVTACLKNKYKRGWKYNSVIQCPGFNPFYCKNTAKANKQQHYQQQQHIIIVTILKAIYFLFYEKRKTLTITHNISEADVTSRTASTLQTEKL